jgi:hemerythrin superfamily protein
MNQNSKIVGSKDVIGFLKAQHHQIKGLFEEVVAARGAERAKSFLELKKLMTAHEAAEEKIVHPAAKSAIPGGPAEVAARVKEELEAKKALTQLSQLDPSSDEFEAEIRKLQSAVLAHASAEEKEEFDKLPGKIDESKLKEMRKAVEAVEAGTPPPAGRSLS